MTVIQSTLVQKKKKKKKKNFHRSRTVSIGTFSCCSLVRENTSNKNQTKHNKNIILFFFLAKKIKTNKK